MPLSALPRYETAGHQGLALGMQYQLAQCQEGVAAGAPLLSCLCWPSLACGPWSWASLRPGVHLEQALSIMLHEPSSRISPCQSIPGMHPAFAIFLLRYRSAMQIMKYSVPQRSLGDLKFLFVWGFSAGHVHNLRKHPPTADLRVGHNNLSHHLRTISARVRSCDLEP